MTIHLQPKLLNLTQNKIRNIQNHIYNQSKYILEGNEISAWDFQVIWEEWSWKHLSFCEHLISLLRFQGMTKIDLIYENIRFPSIDDNKSREGRRYVKEKISSRFFIWNVSMFFFRISATLCETFASELWEFQQCLSEFFSKIQWWKNLQKIANTKYSFSR